MSSLSVNDLLGQGVLFAFATGRYYNPRIEERVLLFIDMRASTGIAERLGELCSLNLLNRLVGDSGSLSPSRKPAAEFISTLATRWSRHSVLRPARILRACVTAVFAALDRIAEQALPMSVKLASFPTSAPACTAGVTRRKLGELPVRQGAPNRA